MAEPPLSAPELLNAGHDVNQFLCRKPSLDHWPKTRALANHQKGFTVVMVVHVAENFVGYYGLAPTAIIPSALPRSTRNGQPQNPAPCALLGQLAIDQAWIGRGIGTGLFNQALARSVSGAAPNGGRSLVVRAVYDEAVVF